MLFNSPAFLFVFLPAAFIGYQLLRRANARWAIAFLTLASFVFYCAWELSNSWVILASILGNYASGMALIRTRDTKAAAPILGASITINLLALGYFKYTGFFVANTPFLGLDPQVGNIVLPLGISFFTFTQIAYLVDVKRGVAREANFLNYCLFVTFFPHLIAGPIVHHGEMMPQFAAPCPLQSADMVAGLALFSIGLFKKIIFADTLAAYASPVFAQAHASTAGLPFFAAWQGAIAYSGQIYYDFSAYSDMAVGLALLFGINLPLNFNSPYKARNIIEFWRRWHMTLSRFLRDYLYLPLGGNRLGKRRRYINLLAVMVIGGLWHGANWTFVVWGALHGIFLALNHLWRERSPQRPTTRWTRGAAWTLTLLCVIIAWVFFRADDLASAARVLEGLTGVNGLGRIGGNQLASWNGLASAIGLLALAMIAPNSQQILRDFRPGLDRIAIPERFAALVLRPTGWWAVATALLMIVAILNLWAPSEFLYYRF
jgi:D-alanyl-lipoteichoic acid acyltransferase DltB (MBOAT superfamily)